MKLISDDYFHCLIVWFVARVNLIIDDNYSSPNTISDDNNSLIICIIRRNILLPSNLAMTNVRRYFISDKVKYVELATKVLATKKGDEKISLLDALQTKMFIAKSGF